MTDASITLSILNVLAARSHRCATIETIRAADALRGVTRPRLTRILNSMVTTGTLTRTAISAPVYEKVNGRYSMSRIGGSESLWTLA